MNGLNVSGLTNLAGLNTGTLTTAGLTNTGTFLAPNGSATLPSYSFTNLTNAGLWTNGIGLLLTTGGSNTSGITVTGSGNVGIGTTVPTAKLHISGGVVLTDNNYGLHIKDKDGNAYYALNRITGTTNTILNGNYGNTSGNLYLRTGSSNGTIQFGTGTTNVGTDFSSKMTMLATGNVGIGTTAPGAGNQLTALFETNQTDVESKAVAFFHHGSALSSTSVREGVVIGEGLDTGDMNISIWTDGTNNIGYIQGITYGSSYNSIGINPNGGNVGIGTTTTSHNLEVIGTGAFSSTLSLADGTSATPGLNFSSDTDSGLWRAGTNILGLTTNGGGALQNGTTINGLSINSTGNVGIGTTSQSADLHIYKAPNAASVDSILKIENDRNGTGNNAVLALDVANGSNGLARVKFQLNGATRWELNDTSDSFRISEDGSTDRFTVRTGGNVGIGFTTPCSKLEIYDNTSSSDINILRVISDVGGAYNVKFRVDSDGDVYSDGTNNLGGGADIAENYPVEDKNI